MLLSPRITVCCRRWGSQKLPVTLGSRQRPALFPRVGLGCGRAPARSRYPEYTRDDLVALAFPGQVFKHTRRKDSYSTRASASVPRQRVSSIDSDASLS